MNTVSAKSYIAGGEQEYIYEIAPAGKECLLLTRDGVCVKGQWRGRFGEFFWGWAPLPKRNKQREAELGLA